MEGAEIIVVVQVLRKSVVKQQSALYDIITVFTAYLVYALLKLIRFFKLFVKKTKLYFFSVAKSYCAHRYSS